MIQVTGKIWFDPKNVTKKHNTQSEWKRMAMVTFEGDMTEYYAWFIKKRYNLELNRPLRGAHISFINDSVRDMGVYADKWDEVKEKYNGTEVTLTLDLDVLKCITPNKPNAKHWWLLVEHGSRKPLLDIRSELGLDKPFWGMHLTIGTANERNIEHSEYIHDCVKKGFIKT